MHSRPSWRWIASKRYRRDWRRKISSTMPIPSPSPPNEPIADIRQVTGHTGSLLATGCRITFDKKVSSLLFSFCRMRS